MSATVEDLYKSHDGYASDRTSSYFAVYERCFLPFRDKPIRLLEIGVQNGGSLQIWKKYFQNATVIVGCDIDPRIEKLNPGVGIELVVGDISLPTTVQKLKTISPAFDIIIDDGSHRSEHIIAAFQQLFPLVAPGGIFLAEDLGCSYWRTHNGRLLAPFSSIEFFKRLIDAINFDHWRGFRRERIVAALTQTLAKRKLDSMPMAELHATVYAVHFYNSICIVEKAILPTGAGDRVLSGNEALVEASVLPGWPDE